MRHDDNHDKDDFNELSPLEVAVMFTVFLIVGLCFVGTAVWLFMTPQ